ncbi:hypothetical protein EVAR_6475_1 [Eumeta japonica]|uniref:Uncharacterized protein n=1 Tax=Eumeta variegata TaxID=151549 RepID=A0A4C1SQH2_EUMVA|nr:hypothetical protein EVAR_6475_1 [Eumeta japonica]
MADIKESRFGFFIGPPSIKSRGCATTRAPAAQLSRPSVCRSRHITILLAGSIYSRSRSYSVWRFLCGVDVMFSEMSLDEFDSIVEKKNCIRYRIHVYTFLRLVVLWS